MRVFYLCQHPPSTVDTTKTNKLTGCPVCGETRRAAVVHDAPRFTASGLAARGPLVKTT